MRVLGYIGTISVEYILYCGCFNCYIMCGYLHDCVVQCVDILVLCVLVFTVFFIVCSLFFCIVSFMYIYSYSFCLYLCKD